MVTATASRAVTADVTIVTLMRDRAASTAGDDDYMAEAITIEAGMMSGTTMVMAVEDNMAEEMEELVLYGMAADNAGEVTGEGEALPLGRRGPGPAAHRSASAGAVPCYRWIPPLSEEVTLGVVVSCS